MSARPAPGGAAIGHLATLAPLPGLVVRALRRWCEGGPQALAADLGEGPADGAPAAALAFDALCRHCLGTARRPLQRHEAACPCLGEDEAALARLVDLAASGAREDALMLGCVMVRPDQAPALVHLAEQAGLALERLLLQRRRVH